MIAFSSESLILLSIGCLILNYLAFRSDAAAAGHGPRAMIKMALIWVAILAGVTALFGYIQ